MPGQLLFQHLERVYGLVVETHFEMQVGTGSSSAGAHLADGLARGHPLPLADIRLRQWPYGGIPTAVVDDDYPAVTPHPSGVGHLAGLGRPDDPPRGPLDIDARVEVPALVEGITPPAVAAGDPAPERPFEQF